MAAAPLSQDRGFLLCGSTESEALSVAFAIHLDDRGVMDQSIDGRRRHGGIGKDRVPGRKRLVGGYSDAVSFVSMRDEFEQDAGLGLILTNIRDVVEHDEIVFVELLEGADQGEVAARDLQPLDYIDGLSEQDPLSCIDESMADGRQSVALAGSAFAEHQEIIAVLDPVPAGTERQKVRFAQLRRGAEVEAGEGFSNRRFGLITMLGSRSSVSKEARMVASVMVISVIAAAPMLRAAADYSHRDLAKGFRPRSIGAFWWQTLSRARRDQAADRRPGSRRDGRPERSRKLHGSRPGPTIRPSSGRRLWAAGRHPRRSRRERTPRSGTGLRGRPGIEGPAACASACRSGDDNRSSGRACGRSARASCA